MTSLSDFAAPEQPPKGWEPYSEQVGQIGSAIVKLPRPDMTRRDLLVAAGFNPDEWTITGDIQVRRWMRYDQEWLYYNKFEVTAGIESDDQRSEDIGDLVEMIRGRRLRHDAPPATGQDAWLYVASDWQIGKGEGDGTPGTVDRVTHSIELAVEHVKNLRRMGRAMPEGVLAGTGDLGEGTCGFFANQAFVTDCNRREQNKIVRSLLTYAIDELSPLFERFTVLSVAGNHGENRNNGKKATDDADNDDVAQFECVKEAFDRAGTATPITWIIPHDELSLAAELGGVKVGFTHGHLFTSGGKLSQAKALEWWKGQVFGSQPVAEAKLLISSHFHHFSAINHGARTHLQTPAMDPGSRWVTNSWGADSPAGVLTLRLDAEQSLGFGDLAVLGGS